MTSYFGQGFNPVSKKLVLVLVNQPKELGLQLVMRPRDVFCCQPRLNVGLARRRRGQLFDLNTVVRSIVHDNNTPWLNVGQKLFCEPLLKAWAIHLTVVVSGSPLCRTENETCPVHKPLVTSSMKDDETTTFAARCTKPRS